MDDKIKHGLTTIVMALSLTRPLAKYRDWLIIDLLRSVERKYFLGMQPAVDWAVDKPDFDYDSIIPDYSENLSNELIYSYILSLAPKLKAFQYPTYEIVDAKLISGVWICGLKSTNGNYTPNPKDLLIGENSTVSYELVSHGMIGQAKRTDEVLLVALKVEENEQNISEVLVPGSKLYLNMINNRTPS
jgi:hypothetical protein